MTTFFRQTAQAMIAKHIDRFPLLKLDQVIDWQPIEQYLNRQKTRYLRDHRGRLAPQQKNHPDKKTIRNASDRSGLFPSASAHQNILRTPILTCQFCRIVCIEDLCASK